MTATSAPRRPVGIPAWVAAVVPLAIFALRFAVQPRGLDAVGWSAVRDASLATLTWLALSLVAAGLGARLLTALQLEGSSAAPVWLLAECLGLGAIGYAVFLLGLLGVLSAPAILTVLAVASLLAAPGSVQALAALSAMPRTARQAWRASRRLPQVALVLLAATFGLAFVQALTPPWDYDGLMYHLVGPRLFLEAGRIYPEIEHWHVNGPSLVEMLFTAGISAGDDVLPKLIHFSFGLIVLAATWALGRRWLGPGIGWLAAVILAGLPTLAVWSSFAYIDLGWVAFELLSLACFVEWWQEGHDRWLSLSGIFAGLAMGSKYLGIMGFGLLFLAVLWATRRRSAAAILKSSARYALPALLLAAPWYMKNALWFGNPVYPHLFGGPDWSAERLGLYSAYLRSFGAGRGLADLLRLPWNAYARHEQFGTVMNQIDVPSLLLLALFLLPFVRRHPIVNFLMAFSLARIVLWFFGSQQLRFLLPAMPWLAIGAAYALVRMKDRLSGRSLRLWRLWEVLAVAFLGVPLLLQLGMMVQFRSAQTVVGAISQDEFLRPRVKDYAVARELELAQAQGKALLLGVGRGYYCPTRCVTDPDHFGWAALIRQSTSCADLTALLRDDGITRIVLSREDLDFLLAHDPAGALHATLATLDVLAREDCLRAKRIDDWLTILELSPVHGQAQPRLALAGLTPGIDTAAILLEAAQGGDG